MLLPWRRGAWRKPWTEVVVFSGHSDRDPASLVAARVVDTPELREKCIPGVLYFSVQGAPLQLAVGADQSVVEMGWDFDGDEFFLIENEKLIPEDAVPPRIPPDLGRLGVRSWEPLVLLVCVFCIPSYAPRCVPCVPRSWVGSCKSSWLRAPFVVWLVHPALGLCAVGRTGLRPPIALCRVPGRPSHKPVSEAAARHVHPPGEMWEGCGLGPRCVPDVLRECWDVSWDLTREAKVN